MPTDVKVVSWVLFGVFLVPLVIGAMIMSAALLRILWDTVRGK